MKAGLYARISLDRREGEGVARQLADCRDLAKKRRWQVAGEYIDNDLSAFRSKRRPEWDRLVADLEAGTIDAVVAYHPDRTYRRLADLESLIDVVERRGAQVATVKAGDIDLATATGRMQARIVAAVSRHESERIGERVSRAKRERAVQGAPPGGGRRPFGYAEGGLVLVKREAKLIREAAARVAAGGSLGAEAQAWNGAGWSTPYGKSWTTAAVRRVLTSPRIAGIRSYQGEEIGAASWPAIIDRDTHDLLVAAASSRVRGPRRPSPWLLSALIECPRCGRPMYGSQQGRTRAYKCAPSTRSEGCGRASVSAGPVEARVVETIDGWLADPPPQLEAWLSGPDAGADPSVELAAVRERRAALARRFASDALTEDEFDGALAVLDRRVRALEGVVRPTGPQRSVRQLQALWRAGTVAERRPLVEALVACPMPLSTERMADPADRLTVEPRLS